MIAQMENPEADDAIHAPYFAYALTLAHKHVPEIITRSGLSRSPIFTPNVARFPQGMLVNVPLHLAMLTGSPSPADVHATLTAHYAGQDVVEVMPLDAVPARIDATELASTDTMRIYVLANADAGHVNIVASLDNLGKGASGAAVQNLELMLQ